MVRRPNVGVIGAGMMGKIAVPVIRFAGGNVTAVLGVDGKEVDALAEATRLGDDAYRGDFGEFDRLLKDDSTDAFYLATPNCFHAEQGIAAASHGKHPFFEKPLATTPEDADRVFDALMQARVAGDINALYRNYVMFGYMADTIRTGRLGKPVKVVMRYLQDWQMNPEQDIGWRPINEIAGKGKLTGDLGAHVIHNTRYLFPNAEFVEFEGERRNVHPVRYKLKKGGAETFGGKTIPSHLEAPELYDAMNMLDDSIYSGDDRASADFVLRLSDDTKVVGYYELDQVSAGNRNNYTVELVFEEGTVSWAQETPNWVVEAGKDGKPTNIELGGAPGITGRPPGHPKGYTEAMTIGVQRFLEEIERAGYGSLTPENWDAYTGRNIGDAREAVRIIAKWNASSLIPRV
jgi:predicted dehydrogenase